MRGGLGPASALRAVRGRQMTLCWRLCAFAETTLQESVGQIPYDHADSCRVPKGRPMLGRIFTVGGFTLLSRLTGFGRDIVLAAVLGAGPVADALPVALPLPNHSPALLAAGAF